MGDTLTKVYKQSLFQPPDIVITIPGVTTTTTKYKVKTEYGSLYSTSSTSGSNSGDIGDLLAIASVGTDGSLDPTNATFYTVDIVFPPASSGSGVSSSVLTPVDSNHLESYTVSSTTPSTTKTITPPLQTITDPNLGWTGAAISEATMAQDGEITFQFNVSNISAYVGLNIATDTATDYANMPYAIRCLNGKYQVFDDGLYRGGNNTFVDSDVFTIRRTNGVVTYYFNGGLIYTSSLISNGALVADASLYSADDKIVDATISSNTYSRGLVSFEPLEVFSCESANCGGVSVSFEPLTVISAQVWTLSFGPLSVFACEGSNCGSVIVAFEPLEISVLEDLLDISISQGFLSLHPLLAGSGNHGFSTITYAPIVLSLPPLEMLGSDRVYGAVNVAFEPMTMIAVDLPNIADGVCKIVYSTDGSQGCGTLLETGKHILTAAHVVEDMTFFDRIAIEFYIPQGSINVAPIEIVNIVIHPDYVGLSTGNDLAIIYLKDEITPLIGRHKLYTGTAEAGQIFKRISFSPRVDPNTGNVTAAGWDITNNRYDDTADSLNALLGLVIPPLSTLGYDYDNGLTINDAYGSKFLNAGLGVSNEGFVSAGDSGSAGMFNGFIAGVLSFGATTSDSPPDLDGNLNSTYGEFAVDTRVSSFESWISASIDNANITACLSNGFNSTITSTVIDNTFGGVLLNGFSSSIIAQGGIEAKIRGLTTTLTTSVTALPYGVFNAVNGFTTVITSSAITGRDITGAFTNGFNSKITAYGGIESVLDNGFSSNLTSTGFFGKVFNASLIGGITTTLTTQASQPNHGVVVLAPPVMQPVYGIVNIVNGFSTTISSGTPIVGVNNAVAYVMNISNLAVTQYTSYDFNYIFPFDGQYYGYKDDGMYLLEGGTDVGVNIDAEIQTSVMDFGTKQHKRVPYLYTDAENEMVVTPYVNEKITLPYKSLKTGRKAQLGRGFEGRFWSFNIKNVGGNDMKLNSIDPELHVLDRKI